MMDRSIPVFITVLVLVTRAGGLRSCVDVQNTLMACIYSSDVSPGLLTQAGPDVDIEQLCWQISVLLECVEDARSTCPHLPILSNPDFTYGVQLMESSRDTYCAATESTPSTSEPTTSSYMQGDQAESCDPLDAMIACNDVMANVTPGDIKAMCGPGDEYLACMTQIVDNCPSHAEVLPFDLQLAIDTTRNLLERECPAVKGPEECAEMIENAKRGCADFLTDGNGDYCSSLKTYMECLDITLNVCPDKDLQSLLSNQYQHHCVQASPQASQDGGRSECPDDVEAAIMECNDYMHDLQSSDRATFCRKSKKYLGCVKDLIRRCENDSRFAMLPAVPLEQLRQQISSVCDSKEDANYLQPRARTRYPLRMPHLLRLP